VKGEGEENDPNEDKWTDKEKAQDLRYHNGGPTPYYPGETTLDALLPEVPPVATGSAPMGMVEMIHDRFRTLAKHHGNEHVRPYKHSIDYAHGNGAFVKNDFERDEVIQWVQAYGYTKDIAPSPTTTGMKKFEFKTLNEATRKAILQSLVGGQYPAVPEATKEDVLSGVDNYSIRNETYLSSDIAKLRAKVQRLLPQTNVPKPAQQAARR